MILVTGATGFIGRSVVERLIREGYGVCVCSRQHDFVFSSEIRTFMGTVFSEDTNWSDTLRDVDFVIHLAARVHVMNDTVIEPLAEFRKVNTGATLNLAKQAAEAGVKRFVFISTIKVNGELTEDEMQFNCNDTVFPVDPYAISKYEAEQGLLEIAKQTKMDVVIIRPPLVYGPGVQANFNLLMKWVDKGVPMPLGAIKNQRSLIALDNLVDFITHCIDHPKAANEIFLISDGKDVSTTELIKKLAKALDKRVWLVTVPVSLIKFIANLLGKRDVVERLFGSLQVDSVKARDVLGWKPVITMDEELTKLVEAYKSEKTV